MKLIKITPRGFCDGVIHSWKLILDAKRDYPNSNIYLLGWFVHNKEFLNTLLSDHLFLLDDTKATRYELIKNTKFKDDDVVILSAHGTDWRTIELLENKKIKYIDTTCKYVYSTHYKLKDAIAQDLTIGFIGKKNHPETSACVAISEKISLITNLEELSEFCLKNKDKKISFFNQSTLSIYDLYDFYKYIKENCKNYILNNDICNATQIRQEALINLDYNVDLVLVVGDQRSNNSKSLCKIAKSKFKNAYLIANVSEINLDWFKNVNSIAITSGASTLTKTTNDVIEYLISVFNIKPEEIIDAKK